jgi:peptide/nickel transport system substrate-binding protein
MLYSKLPVILACAGLLMLFARCDRRPPPPDLTGRDGSNYGKLQADARAFSPSRGQYGGALRMAVSSELTTFCPAYARTNADRDIHSLLYDGLVRIDGVSGEPLPALAERWEVSDDRLVWTFHLRLGAAWSDGVPLSAGDVVFTYKQIVMNQEVSGHWPHGLLTAAGNELGVTAPDSATVRFTMQHPNSAFLHLLSYPILPAHRCASEGEVQHLEKSLATHVSPDSVVGSGPFRLAQYVPHRRAVLVRNPHYWHRGPSGDSLPYLDSVIYELVPDENTKLVRFQRGQSDYYEAHGRDYDQLVEERKHGNYDIHCLGPSGRATALGFNVNPGIDTLSGEPYVDSSKREWFADPAFRTALRHAINTDGIMAALADSAGFRHVYPVRPADTALYLRERAPAQYDTSLARRLLSKAGYHDSDTDAVREGPDGAALRFTLLTNTGNRLRTEMAERIRTDLARVGVVMLVKEIPYDSLYQRLTSHTNTWEAVLVGMDLPWNPQFGREIWTSSEAFHFWHPHQQAPTTLWEQRIDSVFDAALVESDPGRRRALFKEWQRVVADSAPVIFTFLPEQILCISRRFGNVNPSIVGGVLHNVDELFVRPPNLDQLVEPSTEGGGGTAGSSPSADSLQ